MPCPHRDIWRFDDFLCCFSCGDVVSEQTAESAAIAKQMRWSTYRYRSLDEHEKQIRLIHLRPGQADEDLFCDIVHVDLADGPVYEAVSVGVMSQYDKAMNPC
jgi:hypothetical protein